MQRSTLALTVAVGAIVALQWFRPHDAPQLALASLPAGSAASGAGAVAPPALRGAAVLRLAEAGRLALASPAAAMHPDDATAAFRVTTPSPDAGGAAGDGLLWVATLGESDAAMAPAAVPAPPRVGDADAWSLAAASAVIATDSTAPLFDDGISASAGRATQALAPRPASRFTSTGDDTPKVGSGSNGNALDSGVNRMVSPAPEPATWGSLLAGLALVGLNLRRRGPRSVAC